MAGGGKMNIQEYLDEYPKGNKNCYDCLNLRCAPLSESPLKMQSKGIRIARCREGMHRSNEQCRNEDEGKEVFFRINYKLFTPKYKKMRLKSWNIANVCEYFDSLDE
jgi:hypothetical protein